MSALSLYKKHTQQELIALDEATSADPANQAPAGGIYRHTPKARKLIADIAQAITWHMADAREAAGNPVKVAGYSGRKSNR